MDVKSTPRAGFCRPRALLGPALCAVGLLLGSAALSDVAVSGSND
jgi:hypothetical protein